MEREKLKIFTDISFYIALFALISIPCSVYISGLSILGLLAFFATFIGIPLSILSMFSKESAGKRMFALLVNLLPLSIMVYALIAEFTDEFLRSAP
ncbi:2-acyl-glycerophospho-ethanolamine acyltransferase [Metabacillus sp. SLBN-84]